MWKIYLNRIKLAVKHGWRQARFLAERKTWRRICIYVDMLYCFFKYKMWTNIYTMQRFNLKTAEERKITGQEIKERRELLDKWIKASIANTKFLCLYTSKKYELPLLQYKRNKVYKKKYNMAKGCWIGSNVVFEKQHFLFGTIKIGRHVLIHHNVYIDYSGDLEIGNKVSITEGVKILTHGHDYFGIREDIIPNTNGVFKSSLVIADNVVIGTRAIIMPDVHRIGENSIISSASVVTIEVPDNVLVAGNPAKVILRFSKNTRTLFRRPGKK